MPSAKTSNWTYDEFYKWACEELLDALITKGFNGLRTTLKYVVLNQIHIIYKQGGFKK